MFKDSKTFPILITERLTLRQLSKSDAEQIFQLRSDIEINKFLERKPSETIEDAIRFIERIIENESDLFYWAITKRGNGKLIGTICLFDFSSDEKKCEIGYELLSEYQRQGFMHEALKKVTEYANERLRLKKINAITHKDNQSSTGLLLKLGFKQLEIISDKDPSLILFRLSK